MAKVTVRDRKETGLKDGSYPVRTKAQCLSAIKLRHNGDASASTVLSHVAHSKWGSDPTVKAKLAAAREVDRKKK